MCVHTHNKTSLGHKENEIMSVAATCIDLKIVILSEIRQTYDITYMWNLKNKTNEFIYKAGTDSHCYI